MDWQEQRRFAETNGFDAFITADQGVEHQQNPYQLPMPVVILIARRTRIAELEPLIPEVIDLLTRGVEKGFYRIAG